MKINKKDTFNIIFLIIPFTTIPFIYEIFIGYSKNLFHSGYCGILNYRALENLNLLKNCSGLPDNIGADTFMSGAGLVFGIPLYLLNVFNFSFYLRTQRKKLEK